MVASLALEPVVGATGVTALALLAGVLAIAACVAWFVGLDEMAQRAHYVAWFWGSSLGLGVAAVALGIAALFGAVDVLHGLVRTSFAHDDVGDGMMAGMLVIIVPMLAGYALWWTAFWLRRR
jgi:hypothetical protein